MICHNDQKHELSIRGEDFWNQALNNIAINNYKACYVIQSPVSSKMHSSFACMSNNNKDGGSWKGRATL